MARAAYSLMHYALYKAKSVGAQKALGLIGSFGIRIGGKR